MTRVVPIALAFIAAVASAQFVPPVPKTIGGGRGLNRTKEIPLPPANESWLRARSPHFVTLSGASERHTRDVVTQLETVADALKQVTPRFAAEGTPTRVLLFARGRDAAPYFDLLLGHRSPGAFVRAPDGEGTMLLGGTRPFGDRTVFHELVHNLLANSGSRLPLWLEEGVADSFSTAEVNSDHAVRFGAPIWDHVRLLRSRPLMPLGDLFAVDASSAIASSGFFYAESWLVVDWMMRTDRNAFWQFAADLESGKPAMDAYRERFHPAPQTADTILANFEMRPPNVTTVKVAVRPGPPSIEPLQHDDVVIELASFLGSFEATRSDAERFLRSVDQNARAVATLAQLRSRDKRYDDATKLFERALQLDPKNPDIKLSFAESLLGNAIGPFAGTSDVDSASAESFRRARRLATEAMEGGGDAARANAVIGTTYLIEPDPAAGIEPLQRALAARPNRYDVALNLYALLLRSGRRDAAEKLYRDILAGAKTPQAVFAAKAVFVREQLSVTNRFLAAGRNDEAIAVLKQLIDETPDPAAKADLERQLMKIAELRDANRQIARYNEAVEAANAGGVKQAIAILDDLLKSATDPNVIRDATDFRAKLQKRLKRRSRS